MHRRAEFYCQQFDALAGLRQQARHELLMESRKHSAVKLLQKIPSLGPIRAALLVALLQTPHRFRTKRQLWAYMNFEQRNPGDSVPEFEELTRSHFSGIIEHRSSWLPKGAPAWEAVGLHATVLRSTGQAIPRFG